MTDYKPPFRAALLAGFGVLVLYVLTLSPSTAMWDTSEYIATAHILGLPHPPGNPLFVALGRAWSVLLSPTGLPVAVRINLLAAVTSAVAAGFYFMVVHRILWAFVNRLGAGAPAEGRKPFFAPLWTPMVGASVSVLISATAFTVWNQSTVNEKVYTVSVAVIAAVVWLSLRWMDKREEEGGIRYLLAAVYLIGLGSTNHLMSALPLPALGLFVLLVSPAVLLKRGFWVKAVPLVLIGLSFNFFLPIRAAQDPVINEGDPTCEGVVEAAVAVFTNGRAGCENLALVLSRFQYQKPPISDRQAPLGDQFENYFQYFDWQWARGLDASELPRSGRNPVTLVFLILGLWGLWLIWRTDRGIFYLLGGLTLTVTLGLVFYLNFKYGYSLAPEVQTQSLHEVRERDYFFIVGFGLWGVLAGIGLTALWLRISESLSGARRQLIAAPVLLIAFIPLGSNWVWASRAGDYSTRDWAYNLLMSVEPYGVIFTNGDNDTFPLWYVQEVEEIRQDVTVVVGQYLYTSWHPKQLQEMTSPGRQRPFRPEQGGGLYEAPETPPRTPILTLAPEEIDRIAGGSFPNPVTVSLGPVAVQYPADTYLDRMDQITLAMIISSMDERPIYFATPSGILGRLGLGPWAIRQGLVAKLVPRDLEAPQDSGLVMSSLGYGEDWFDVERSLNLMENVYSYRGFKDRLVWSDRSTLNIPWYFYLTSVQLADAVSKWEGGTQEQVLFLTEQSEAFLVTARGGSLAYSEVEEGG
jgi:hypothetical protein